MTKVDLNLSDSLVAVLDEWAKIFGERERGITESMSFFLKRMMIPIVPEEEIAKCKDPDEVFQLWLSYRKNMSVIENSLESLCSLYDMSYPRAIRACTPKKEIIEKFAWVWNRTEDEFDWEDFLNKTLEDKLDELQEELGPEAPISETGALIEPKYDD